MNTENHDLIAVYKQLQKELLGGSSENEARGSTAAMLVLASEVRGVKNELNRIAGLLGADTVQNGKISQSDVASTMLSLLAALSATGNEEIK